MKRIVNLIIVSAVFGFSSARAAGLSGSVIGANGEPVSGCVVCLLKAALTDTTVGGTFRFADVQTTATVPAYSGISRMQGRNLYVYVGSSGIVSLAIFDLRGRMVGQILDRQRLRRGTYRFDPLSFVPNSPAQGVYTVRVTVDGRTAVHPLMAAGNMPSRSPVNTKAATVARASVTPEDTLLVSCPGYAAKKIPVASYSAALGKIVVTQASAAAFSEVVFAVRNRSRAYPDEPHWYANFGYYGYDSSIKAYGANGYLCKLNMQTKAVTNLISDPTGAVRDPVVSYDGLKILFSWRKGGTQDYNLYEINVDGTGLKQITSGPWNDFEPCYLPDGGIVFASSRCKRYVNCWMTQVANVYRCDGDGKNIRQLEPNIEQDNTPWILPDGRVLYTRWEYVDRSQVSYHQLWYMRPDGTGQMVYFGNQHVGDVYIDAKPIPGTNKVVFVNSGGHGAPEHMGAISIVSDINGPDDLSQVKQISGAGNCRDPYPVSADSFLVAQETKLIWMKANGVMSDIYTLSGTLAANRAMLHEPRPIMSRPKEPVLASQVNLSDSTGKVLLLDTYIGRNMAGVNRGDIKKLLILETLPKPVSFNGGMDPISIAGSFTLNRIIGTVPVEPDGSAYMELPANRSCFFVALDSNDLSVKRMQSFTTVMPGENNSCIGCHELRTMIAPNMPPRMALQKPASRPQPVPGMPANGVIDYPRDIQPIWNKYCLDCHDVDKKSGGVLLTGDNGPQRTLSYYQLSMRLQMADGRNQTRSNYAPRTIGSVCSPLLKKVDGSHNNVTLTAQDLRLVKLWLDASATFPGTYASLGGYTIYRWGVDEEDVMNRRCNSCHTGSMILATPPSEDLNLFVFNGGKDFYFYPLPWLTAATDDYARNVGSAAWMKKYANPRLQFCANTIFNLTRPDKSVLLLAPLAKTAGGYGTCGSVFANTSDADYLKLLKMLQDSKVDLDNWGRRFNMPNFQPPEAYIREMKRFGILPSTFKRGDPINVYDIDKKYWESLWWKPQGTGVTSVIRQ